jgi:hypothetical protein
VETQPSFAMFKPLKLQLPINRPRSAKRQPFEFSMGSILVDEMESSIKGSKNPMTQTNTPKYAEEVAIKMMQASK